MVSDRGGWMTSTQVDGKSRFWIGQVEVDPEGLRLRISDKDISLEPKVMQVLVELAINAEEVVSRAHLIETIWNVTYGGDESLTRAISILRKHLEDGHSARRIIVTVPRRGYRLACEVTTDRSVNVPDDEPLSAAGAEKQVQASKPNPWFRALPLVVIAAVLAGLVSMVLFRPAETPQPTTFLVELIDEDGVLPRLEAQAPGFEGGLAAANRDVRVFSEDTSQTEFELRLSGKGESDADEFQSELYYRDFKVPMLTLSWKRDHQSSEMFAKQFVLVTSHVTNCFGDLIGQMDTGLQTNTDFLPMLFDLCYLSRTGHFYRPGSDVTNKMIDVFPDSPGAEALHALLLLSQPTRHYQGRKDIREEALLSRVAKLLSDAKAGGQSGELIRIGETLLKARHADMIEQEALLSTIDGSSWAAVTAGNWRVTLLRRTGRLAEAEYLLSETVRKWPGYEDFYIALSLAQAMQGVHDQAFATISDAREVFPGRQQLDVFSEMLTLFYLDDAAAQKLLEAVPVAHIKDCLSAYRTALRDKSDFDSGVCDRMDPTHRSRLFALLGDYDNAMAMIETFSEGAPGVGTVIHYAEFYELWKTDRMWAVADRFGLIEYWRTTGKKPDICFTEAIRPICDQKI